jgi:hypothetical protein
MNDYVSQFLRFQNYRVVTFTGTGRKQMKKKSFRTSGRNKYTIKEMKDERHTE